MLTYNAKYKLLDYTVMTKSEAALLHDELRKVSKGSMAVIESLLFLVGELVRAIGECRSELADLKLKLKKAELDSKDKDLKLEESELKNKQYRKEIEDLKLENQRLKLQNSNPKHEDLILRLQKSDLENKQYKSENEELRHRIEQAESENSKNAALMRRLENPNTPPSANTPAVLEAKAENRVEFAQQGRSGRQKGHPGVSSSDQPSETTVHKLEKCVHCGSTNLEEVERSTPKIVRDLPKLPEITVTAHIRCTSKCRDCGKTSTAPDGSIPGTSVGPNLGAYMTYLSRRPMSLEDIRKAVKSFGLNISKSAVQYVLESAGDKMKPAYEEIKKKISEAKCVHADETPYMMKNKRGYIWTAATTQMAVIFASLSRSIVALDQILPNRDIAIICDGYVVYGVFRIMQRCWAHILRETKAVKGKSSEHARLHKTMQEIFHNAKMKRKKTDDEPDIDTKPMENAVLAVVSMLRELGEGKIATKLENATPNLFTFVNHPGMAPTNNLAERILRPPVLHRKVRFRMVSQKGRETYSILMTCMMTWEMQGLNVMKMLRETLTS